MNLEGLRSKSNLLADLPGPEMRFLESVATEVGYSAGQVVFSEDEQADTFFIVAEGKVGLEIGAPGKSPMVIQTLGEGDLVGISWLFPPYRWQWTARTHTESVLVAFDAVKVRKECELDRELDSRVLRAVAAEAARRLHHTRLQLLDLYEKG
ncbi:MAG TPA: cyclic nucleotide-binding domain-containing protein [Acidimicrobiia bacterium]